ncbi:MAG: LysR family transcriptional regulator [Lachnospiraceae bacterium]|nr:LysR family transcriptional regulator [Lachnospiraceae bacterium]
MDLKQLEYIIAIADYGNISKAAQKFYVTPSAMNQQLLRLENELGIALFVRNHRHMEATAAGRLYIENARAILSIKQNTYSALKDLVGQYSGEYRIGLPMEHGMDAFLNCYEPFRKEFPGIQLVCQEGMVNWQLQQLSAGTLDVAFVLLTAHPETDDQYFELSQENLLLGIPVSHPVLQQLPRELRAKISVQQSVSVSGDNSQTLPLPTFDLALLKDADFALMRSKSTQRQSIDPLFRQAGFTPRVIMESTQNRAIRSVASKQLCCCIVPQTYAMEDRENLVWFSLPTCPRFTFYAVIKKGIHPAKPLKHLISLYREYAQAHFDYPFPFEAEDL